MELYVEVSREIRKILDDATPVVEPLSIDEAFMDLTGVVADLQEGRDVAARLRERIRSEQRLTASVGVAPNKFLAKVASDLEKPDGLVVLPMEAVPDRLWPLPVERLWGVGPRTAKTLHSAGIRIIGDLLRVSAEALESLVGDAGAAHLQALARGEDDRPVQPHREAKSISEERTYGTDLLDPDAVDRALLERAEGVSRELRHEGLVARTVHIKVRTGDFTTWTRARTLSTPTDLTEVIVCAARQLFRERIRLGTQGLRLLGVGVSGFEPAGAGQGALFPDAAEERARKMARVTDAVRDRMGDKAITRARLLPRRKRGKTTPPEASSLPSVD
jgi:nucleotidyltransferase/DNA polymerase involved in DNA repair